MVIMALGSAGLGLVWGWLLGMLTRRKGFRGWNLASLAGLAAQAAEIWWWANGWALALFIGAVALAFLLYLAWQQELRRRVARAEHS